MGLSSTKETSFSHNKGSVNFVNRSAVIFDELIAAPLTSASIIFKKTFHSWNLTFHKLIEIFN